MKTTIIASIALLAAIGCGASPEEMDELGQTQEAISAPSGYGFTVSSGGPCTTTSQDCLIPVDKTLRTNLVQLQGCAGSLWQNAFNASTVLFNNDAAGTGFHTATQSGNLSLTPRCVAAGFGGPLLRLRTTSLGFPFILNGVGYQEILAASLELAGNDIVAHCSGAHLSNQQCQDFIRDQFRALLNQSAGNRKNELTLTLSDKARMQVYTP